MLSFARKLKTKSKKKEKLENPQKIEIEQSNKI